MRINLLYLLCWYYTSNEGNSYDSVTSNGVLMLEVYSLVIAPL